jgi:hypothetical protein
MSFTRVNKRLNIAGIEPRAFELSLFDVIY